MEIPLKICDGKELDWRGTPNYYCPDFDNSHFIHGGFYSDKFSWMRMALHICDSRPEAKIKRISEGKTYIDCANEVESKNYFEGIVIGVEALSNEVSIDDDFSKNLYKPKER